MFWNWGTKNGILESIVAEDYVMPLTDIADMSLFEKDGEKTMISGICYVDDVLLRRSYRGCRYPYDLLQQGYL